MAKMASSHCMCKFRSLTSNRLQLDDKIEFQRIWNIDIEQFEVIIMLQLPILYSVAALIMLPGQLLFYLGIFSRVFFPENSGKLCLRH